ncbi:MAG: patatin-like phospholipase family protein [Candidatus Omnitrophota bacterium]
MKDIVNKDSVLSGIALFAGFSRSERRLVRNKAVIREYRKGQVIYEEGDPADSLYCVVLGRVVVYTRDSRGNEVALEYLHRGRYFGIISLLTNEPHSVTARAVNDCLLLIISKEGFDYLLNRIPRLAIDLSQTLSRRLKNKDLHQKTIFESTVVAVYSSYSRAGKTVYAMNLALSLKKETRKSVIILDICPAEKTPTLPRRLDIREGFRIFDLCRYKGYDASVLNDFLLKDNFGVDMVCFSYHPKDDSCVKSLLSILSALVNDYHYIVLDLPAATDEFVIKALNQSDLIHLLSSPESSDLNRTSRLIERLAAEFRFNKDKIKVIINEYKKARLSHEEQTVLLGQGIFATLPMIGGGVSERMILDAPDSEYARAVRRISRQLGGCLVGLALGVGMAYGFCHVGVLKVIEEEKIPIDVLSGASFGALIASLWAIGRSSSEIMEIAGEFRDPKNIWGVIDVTFPALGFIKGNKLYNFLKRHLGSKTFCDVRMPLKIVASDIRRKESKVFQKGLLVDAIMASCSMPGVFRPFTYKEGMFLDGGVINPLPTEPLFEMGVKKIIAVNVTPSREDIMQEYAKMKEEAVAIKERRCRGLVGFLRRKLQTNILDIIFSSIEIMQSEIIEGESQLADIVLHPKVHGLHWLELSRAQEFAKIGEDEARRNLDAVWKVIND